MEDERISQLGKSETVIEQNIKSLKQLFPQVFTEDKINFSLLEDLLGEKIEDKKEYYELSWAGKSDARKELSKSTVATLTPDREKSVDFDNTQNIFIEGENLEVLRTLQKSYFGKIKMIYIDPPYNTGNDSFVYPDNYSESKKEYEKRIGKIDEEGYINKVELWKQNSKENGQYHSVWLSMMYSRLSYAYSLLSEDGVIFISIDDNEQANLKLLCDSIFGEENCLLNIIINRTSEIATDKTVQKHEYLICYSKNINKLYLTGENRYTISRGTVGNEDQTTPIIEFPKGLKCINIPDGTYENTRIIEGSKENIINHTQIVVEDSKLKFPIKLQARWRSSNDMKNFFNNNCEPTKAKINGIIDEIYFDGDRFMPQIKKLIVEKIPSMYLENIRGSSELNELGLNGIFDFPKSSNMIKYFIKLLSGKDSIILDFFAGSCTTGHAVMELNKEDGGNRKYICIQMPEKTDKKSEAFKQGYEKISDIGAERLRRAGKRIKEEIEKDRKENDEKLLDKKEIKDIDTGFKYYRLTPSHFKVWQNDINENELGKQLDAFIDATKEGSVEEEMLYELILKSGFSLTTPIEKNSKGFYYIKEWQTCIALENFNKETIESIFELKPKEVITLDKFFKNNDSLLSNTRLEFKDKEIILTII